MPVTIDDIRISNDFNSGNTRYLHGNVFWKLNIEIDFSHRFYYEASVDDIILTNPLPLYTAGDGIIQLANTSGEFSELRVGDIVNFLGFDRNVLEVIDNSTIRVNAGLTQQTYTSAILYLNTPYNSIDYYFGLVGNNESVSYLSKIDQSMQRFQLTNLTGVYQQATAIGNYKSWLLGDCQIKTNGTGTFGKRNFQIKQTLYINPLFLRDYDNLVTPSYFLNSECLRHVFKIEVRPAVNDFTRIRTKEYSLDLGNSGWFNENFNTGLNNYSISNLLFEKETPLTVVDGVLLVTGNRTKVTFDVDNTSTSPFSGGLTKGAVSFINVPFEDAEYKNTTTSQSDNFLFDQVLATAAGATVSGTRLIEQCQILLISTSKITVVFYVNLDNTEYAKISAMDTQKYLIAFNISNHSLSAGASDGVTLLVKYDTFAVELGTDNVVTSVINRFIQHPKFGTTDEGFDNDFAPEDEIVNYLRFKIDATTAFVVPELIKIESGVRLYNTTTQQGYELDSISVDVSNRPIVNGIQYANESIQRAFQAPTSEAIKTFTVVRDSVFDAPPIWFFDLYFPFLVRWEYWIFNPNIPSSFYNVMQQQNGLNHLWYNLDTIAPWVLQSYHDITLNFDGALSTYRITKNFLNDAYGSNLDWGPCTATFEDENNNPLGFNILGFADTIVTAAFTWIGVGLMPDVTALGMVLRLEPYENGGRYISTRIGSYRPKGAESQFKSIDLSDMVVISVSGNTVYGTAKIDYTKLQNFDEFTITGRLYELAEASDCAADNIISEDDICFITENDENLIQE